jgi:two-component system, LuxR family, response regulator FixJ
MGECFGPQEAPGNMAPIPGTVFVVDDDSAVRSSLEFALELEGFRVRSFETGADLLAEADIPGPGCFVIDYQMPGLDGLELIRRLRLLDVDFPAILIASRATEGLIEAARRLGVHRVVEKPLDGSSLSDAIRASLKAQLPLPAATPSVEVTHQA